MRTILRITGALLGIGAAFLALWLPLMAWVTFDAEAGWRKNHPASFWRTLGFSGTMLIVMALLAAISYAFLRYAFRKHQTGDLPNAR
jgi:hypothetical protein